MSSANWGIEKIGIYPGQYVMPVADLARERGIPLDEVENNLFSIERSVFAPWEDAVTMAVNAADPVLTEEDRRSIGLLIAATETSVDQEKSLSSWIHDALGLPEDCRNFEIKHACMGVTDGIRMALSWLRTSGRGRKALVVTGDRSLLAFGKPWEPINGGIGAAVLLSSNPAVLHYDSEPAIYSRSITDVIRPTPWLETGNSEESLYAYLETLDGALTRFLQMYPEAQHYGDHFAAHIYHTPFGGMTYRAHRCALQIIHGSISKQDSEEDFRRKVWPAIAYNRRIGTTFGASTLVALSCLLHTTDMVNSGDRLSWFSYGAGSVGEFSSVMVGEDAERNCNAALLQECLDKRTSVSVAEYEAFEREIDAVIGKQTVNFDVSLQPLPQSVKRRYALAGIHDYERQYKWSA